MPLTIGQCTEENCERDALENHDRCAYHRAVKERQMYERIKDSGKLVVLLVALGYTIKKAYDMVS